MGVVNKIITAFKELFSLSDEEVGDQLKGSKESKGRIPFEVLVKALKETLEKNKYMMGTLTKVPMYYVIKMNKKERSRFGEFEGELLDQLRDQIYPVSRDYDPDIRMEEIVIELQDDDSIPDGKFRVSAHMKKEDVSKSDQKKKSSPPMTRVERKKVEPERSGEGDSSKTVVKPRAKKSENEWLYKISIRDEKSVWEEEVYKPKITIGRGKQDDIVLESPEKYISRNHAEIEFLEGRFYIISRGDNETFVGEEELEVGKRVEIKRGDEIKIEQYRLVIL